MKMTLLSCFDGERKSANCSENVGARKMSQMMAEDAKMVERIKVVLRQETWEEMGKYREQLIPAGAEEGVVA